MPKELPAASITDMDSANRYIEEVYRPAFNVEFQQPAKEDGSAFVALRDPAMLDDILCQGYVRVVGRDNCVRFESVTLQIPSDSDWHRCHYIKAKVKVRQHMAGAISISHGPSPRFDAAQNPSSRSHSMSKSSACGHIFAAFS